MSGGTGGPVWGHRRSSLGMQWVIREYEVEFGGVGVECGGIGVTSGVLGLILGLWGQVKGWGVGSRGVWDESGGAGGHIPMLNAKSLKNSEIWPKT